MSRGTNTSAARRCTDPAAVRAVARQFPSFRDFVDDALFHPKRGYYSTGAVRFGEGGHYETFPLALSPLFGRMVAQGAYRRWRRWGEPRHFELCEIGAGNGQLCVDVLAMVDLHAARGASSSAWRRFARTLRYHVVERSPALIARQQAQLGALAARVTWTRADLSRRSATGVPFAEYGLIVANEVLDCLAHHQIVPLTAGSPGVVFVVPTRRGGASFRELLLPLSAVRGLETFLRRHCPELFLRRHFPPYFAAPAFAVLMRNTRRLYRHAEALWIDYGDDRAFHLRTPARRRLFAGPPRSRAGVYDHPGHHDITFMVDFELVASVAHDAGWRVGSYGPQRNLARFGGVTLDRRAHDMIVRARALGWLLALAGVGPERSWRHTGLTWQRGRTRGGRLTDDVRRSVDEFMGRRPSPFKLLRLRAG